MMRKPPSANLYLSQKERLGLSLLMLTLVVFIMVPYLWRPKIHLAELSSLPKIAPIIKKSFAKNSHPPESKPEKPSPGELKSKNKITSEVIELFYFDPNNLNESASKKMGNLLYLIAVILIIGWALGFFVFHAGGLLHILLVIALIAIILRVIQGGKVL